MNCDYCQFKCVLKSDWSRHIVTSKHLRNVITYKPDWSRDKWWGRISNVNRQFKNQVGRTQAIERYEHRRLFTETLFILDKSKR